MINLERICIDMEYSTFLMNKCHYDGSIQKNKKMFCKTFQNNDEVLSKIAHDCGTDGLIFPKIETVEQAKKAVELSFYPPIGKRGSSLQSPTLDKLEQYVSLNQKNQIFMMKPKKYIWILFIKI